MVVCVMIMIVYYTIVKACTDSILVVEIDIHRSVLVIFIHMTLSWLHYNCVHPAASSCDIVDVLSSLLPSAIIVGMVLRSSMGISLYIQRLQVLSVTGGVCIQEFITSCMIIKSQCFP